MEISKTYEDFFARSGFDPGGSANENCVYKYIGTCQTCELVWNTNDCSILCPDCSEYIEFNEVVAPVT